MCRDEEEKRTELGFYWGEKKGEGRDGGRGGKTGGRGARVHKQISSFQRVGRPVERTKQVGVWLGWAGAQAAVRWGGCHV